MKLNKLFKKIPLLIFIGFVLHLCYHYLIVQDIFLNTKQLIAIFSSILFLAFLFIENQYTQAFTFLIFVVGSFNGISIQTETFSFTYGISLNSLNFDFDIQPVLLFICIIYILLNFTIVKRLILLIKDFVTQKN
ncbi:MAG: hypothetical protein RJA07_976 [Bacteroidota bacterium]|jgi:hypothetical protein